MKAVQYKMSPTLGDCLSASPNVLSTASQQCPDWMIYRVTTSVLHAVSATPRSYRRRVVPLPKRHPPQRLWTRMRTPSEWRSSTPRHGCV